MNLNLNKLIADLIHFQLMSGNDVDDPRKKWILSKDELEALDCVIDTIKDCEENGAATSKLLKELEKTNG